MRTLKRREFLVGSGCVAAGGWLVACGGAAPTGASAAPQATAAPAASPIRVRLGQVSVSAANSAIWAAEDGGYLKKYGLDAEVSTIADSTQAVAAMLAGEVPLNCGISGTAVVASSLGGSDLVFVAVTVNTFPSSIYVKSAIQSVSDLRGKKLGVTRFGTASDTAGRVGLRAKGLDPAQVTFLQMGGLNETLAGLQSGQLDGGVLSPPITLLARKAGFRELIDVGALGIEYVYNGVATSRSFVRQNGAVVANVLKALIEGVQRFRSDPDFGKSVVANRTKLTDAEQVEETWRLFATKYLKQPPFLTDAGLRTVLDELVAVNNPKAQSASPSSFYDDGILKKLDSSGFIKSIVG